MTIAFAAFLGLISSSSAAVVVLFNGTGEPVNCMVQVADDEGRQVQLAVGETLPITSGRNIYLTYTASDGVKKVQLDAWMAYMFVTKKKTGLEVMTCDLLGKSPGLRDVPQAAPVVKPLIIGVKLMVDETERRTTTAWNAALKKRFEEASAILLAQAGVKFVVMDTEEWASEGAIPDLRAAMTDFEKQAKPEPAALAIGFSSREFAVPKGGEVPFAMSRGMFAPFILIREGAQRTEPERVEVLVQQLGRYLGAVVSPDPISVMRPKLGDGKANHVRFRIGFDPLNALAINLAAEELRKGEPKKLAEWPEITQVRLARVYATLTAAIPEETMNEEVMALLERAGLRGAAPEVKPMPDVKPAEPKPAEPKANKPLKPQQEAIRKVVKAIVVKAEENAAQPLAVRVKGDALTELYIRTAADVAFGLENEYRKQAFLVALGIALDDSEAIRSKPVFGELWKAVESDDERKVRLVVLGNPTLRSRRDLCQHFVLSAALTSLFGVEAAEMIGLEKEKFDMERPNGSGFSFCDLAADYAGVELAAKVQASGEVLNTIRQKFAVNDYVPKIDDLQEGLSKAKFEASYGSTSDKRFLDAVADVKKRVKELRK